MMRILKVMTIVVAAHLFLGAALSSAAPSSGSLLVPGDIAPGNYWAIPSDSIGGYVEVCADYQCDVAAGLIENYTVDGRTMVVVPNFARLVNVSRATLTPVDASAVAPPANTGDSVGEPNAMGCPSGWYVDPANLSSCLAPTPGNDFVSLATSSSNPGGVAFGSAPDQAQADDIAVAQCVALTNSACRVAAQAYHACAAVALTASGTVVGGMGPDPESASVAALDAAPGGTPLGGYCAEPPGN